MRRAFLSVHFHEDKDVYFISITTSTFEEQDLLTQKKMLETSFSKSTVTEAVDSYDWVIKLLHVAVREVHYEAHHHLAPGAVNPIGAGIQHVPVKDGEAVDG